MQTPRPKTRAQYDRIMCLKDVPSEHVMRMFDWLGILYNAPSRVYHNWDHIEEMLDMAAILVPARINLSQYYAILFHDAIYEPGVSGNEAASAESLRLFLKSERQYGIWVAPPVVTRACHIIMDTVAHRPTCANSAVMLDLDLMRLAGTYDQFLAYSNMVEEEYSVIVGHEDFMVGRLNFMKSFLARPRLFHTAFGEKNWELPARNNIKKYLQENRGYIAHAKVLH